MQFKSPRLPTIGGWLTMFNFVTLVSLMLILDTPCLPESLPYLRLLCFCSLLVLMLPIGWGFALPLPCGLTEFDAVVDPIMWGVNAFIWGYGVAMIVRSCRNATGNSAARSTSAIEV